MRAWTPQQVLEIVVGAVVIGTCVDLWSMKTMLLESVLAFLINVKDVLGVECVGNAILVRFAQGD